MLAVLSLTWVIRDDVRPSRIASPQEDEQKGASDAPAVRQLERAAEGRRLECGDGFGGALSSLSLLAMAVATWTSQLATLILT